MSDKRERLSKEIRDLEQMDMFFRSSALQSWFDIEEQKLIEQLCDRYQRATEAERVDNIAGQIHALRKLRRYCEDAGKTAERKSKQRAELDE